MMNMIMMTIDLIAHTKFPRGNTMRIEAEQQIREGGGLGLINRCKWIGNIRVI